MKKKYFFSAFAAVLLFAGAAFTSCDDDDDNPAPGTRPTIKFENVIPTKNYVQSGSFAAVAPGSDDLLHFPCGQRAAIDVGRHVLLFHDLFFAPENPGIRLFNDSGVPIRDIAVP